MMLGIIVCIVDLDIFVEKLLMEMGMLLFCGLNVFGGYLKDVEKMVVVFCDGWFVMGDLVCFDEDGFLFIEGWLLWFLKIGGEMVLYGMVENAIVLVFDWDLVEI